MDIEIREIVDNSDIQQSVGVIKAAFKTVAVDFNLTRKNCPTHPSFITIEKLMELYKMDVNFFALLGDRKQIGFIATEKVNNELYYIEKLAILPEYRHNGYGSKLVNFVFSYIKNAGGKIISIGIIDEQAVLKNWYKQFGFSEIRTQKFDRLPFTVCFLEMRFY